MDWDPTRVLRLVESVSTRPRRTLSRLSLDVQPEALMALIDASRALCRAGAAHQPPARELQAAADRTTGHRAPRSSGWSSSSAVAPTEDAEPSSRRRGSGGDCGGEHDPRATGLPTRPLTSRSRFVSRPRASLLKRPTLMPPRWTSNHRSSTAVARGEDSSPVADVIARLLGNLEVVVAGRPVEEWAA